MFFKNSNTTGLFLYDRDHENIIIKILDYKGYEEIYGYCLDRTAGILFIDFINKNYYVADEIYKTSEDNKKISFKDFLKTI